MKTGQKLITISLRDFALPVPRTGSIESLSGYGRALDGQEMHFREQKKRAKSAPAYEAEVPVRREFDCGGFRFRIEGRMDGIFRGHPPEIEEIKTGFNVRELAARLAGDPMAHPYGLQLLSYGYFYWLEHRVLPELAFHIVSTRSREIIDFECLLDCAAYENWLERRLNELVADARKAEKRAARRRKVAAGFPFPFQTPRPGQTAMIHYIEEGIRSRKPMLIQAPTGLGKTVGVLYPALRDALGRGQRVVYITPKNSQHSVAEDAVFRFQDSGAKIKSLTITAKSKICFKNEPLCNPEYCEYARDYHAKVQKDGILDILAKKKKLTARIFRKIAEESEVCPFELQLDCADEADVVICDYNYVFAPRSAFGRITLTRVDQEGKPNLVIDEAHNLPSRAMDYYSPSLSTMTLESMRPEIRGVPARFRPEAENLLDSCIRTIATCRPEESVLSAKIEPPLEPFLEQDARLRAFLSRYLDSEVEIGQRDAIMRLCFSWSEFVEALVYAADPDRQEFFTTFHADAAGSVIKVTCCDASVMMKGSYTEYEQVMGFSATLKPFDYYARLSGLDPENILTAEFPSPFPKENRKLLIIPQVSTKYADRERNYQRIADAVERITSLRRGNYFAFFPSFDFLERVHALFQPPADFVVLRQERDMKAPRVETVLEQLRANADPAIVFAVQGGMLSEGVDYPGEMAIGAFVIGPPLPNFDLEREYMREYYQKRYSAGFDYAYVIPAMAKAVQAAGRVIRSETDRGLIVLMDNRFVQPGYSRAMPADWFDSRAEELVSSSILKEVSAFWVKASVLK